MVGANGASFSAIFSVVFLVVFAAVTVHNARFPQGKLANNSATSAHRTRAINPFPGLCAAVVFAFAFVFLVAVAVVGVLAAVAVPAAGLKPETFVNNTSSSMCRTRAFKPFPGLRVLLVFAFALVFLPRTLGMRSLQFGVLRGDWRERGDPTMTAMSPSWMPRVLRHARGRARTMEGCAASGSQVAPVPHAGRMDPE